jgi:hypothetical protein
VPGTVKSPQRAKSPPRNQPDRPRPGRPSELEQVEARIERQEEAVADLERRLADDWNDVELLTAHRAARDELQSLLDRWETLFAEAHASTGTVPSGD